LCAIDKNDKSNLIYFYIIYLISSKFEFCANKFIYIIENLICLLFIHFISTIYISAGWYKNQ